MSAEDETVDPIEEIRAEIRRMAVNQTARITRQDTTIPNIVDSVGNLTAMMKELQSSLGRSGSSSEACDNGQKATLSIRLDLPKFQGSDPEGWIFQADEYFSFHGVTDDSRIQIVGFHMTKGVVSWMRGLRRKDLLITWEKFK